MTQLLQEMIVLREANLLNEHVALLLEYLGTLAVVDKQLVKSLKNVNQYYGDKKKATKLGTTIGAKSKVEKRIATGRNSDQLWKLFDEDVNIVAMIFDFDGSQVMAVSDRNRLGVQDGTNATGRGDSNKPTMFTVTTDAFYSKVMPEEEFDQTFAKASYARAGSGAKTIYDNKAAELKGGATQARSFVRKVLDALVKKARADGKDVEVLYIYKDTDRVATKADRHAAKVGKVAIPGDKKVVGRRGETEYQAYLNTLKAGLRARLDKFKASKAKSFTSVAEMLEFIKKEGYLDKLKLDGMNYNMKNANLHLDNMIKKARGAKDDNGWLQDSYVNYEMDWDERSAVYTKMRKEVAAANPDMSSDDVYKELEAKIPPRTIKVIFKLEGGVIVPSEVKYEK
jgi:hypothetical protein